MNAPANGSSPHVSPRTDAVERQMDLVIGYVLLGGVTLSVLLILAGLLWRLVATGRLSSDYTVSGMNLAQFVAEEVRLLLSGELRPRLFVNLGIVTLMLTPLARVLASVLFFAFAERNLKYTAITAFVLAVLSYSLFLR